MLILLATASPSDEIDHWVWQLAWISMILATLAAIVAFAGSFTAINRHGRCVWIALIAALFYVFPIGFFTHIHTIDFVAVAGDGTEVSGPLWQAVLLPTAPLLIALAVAWSALARRAGR